MIAKIWRALRAQGAIALVVRGFEEVLRVATGGRLRFVWYVLVAQPVRLPPRIPRGLGHAIATRVVEQGDPLLNGAPRPGAVLEDRFAQGAICIIAERGGDLVGFLWLCPARYIEDEVRCVFVLPGSVWWDFDVWVAPDHRNGVVFAKLWGAAHAHMRAAGVQWTCSRIARQNSASLAAHRRLAATTIGNAIFVCGSHWQLMIARLPRVQISLNAASFPTLHVKAPEDWGE